MSNVEKAAQAIQAALDRGPSEGPWFVCRRSNDDGTVDIETGRTGQSVWTPAQNCEQPTADYIAACNPENIRALLTERAALMAELAAARQAPAVAVDEPECETCNRLVQALREATEGPTFMGEPVLAASSTTQTPEEKS